VITNVTMIVPGAFQVNVGDAAVDVGPAEPNVHWNTRWTPVLVSVNLTA
jgi:hypothetical protein